MAYNILYIEDQSSDSRAADLRELEFEVIELDPSSDISEILALIDTNLDAIILDYRLTEGDNNACYDAPTVAQTIRSKHAERNYNKLPIILMSNESNITDYYKDFTSKDLFDLVLTKQQFLDGKKFFGKKIKAFINSYRKIRSSNFDLVSILGLKANEKDLIDPRIIRRLDKFDAINKQNNKSGRPNPEKNIFTYDAIIYEKIICSIGLLIGDDVLAARLGVSKESEDWSNLLENIKGKEEKEEKEEKEKGCKYTGVFSEVYSRWWMSKVENWWKKNISESISLRRLSAEERVDLIKEKLSLPNLIPAKKTTHSRSSNFWTICIKSNKPLDPFDGIEILKDYLPWQEKEYISFDTALENPTKYKDTISPINKKAVRQLATKIRKNG